MAQLCSCCDLPATYYFAVSYRGQVLRGAICEEHGNAVARERLGIQDPRVSLGSAKIGRALTDPSTKPPVPAHPGMGAQRDSRRCQRFYLRALF